MSNLHPPTSKPDPTSKPQPAAGQVQDTSLNFQVLKPVAYIMGALLFCAVVIFAAYSVAELFGVRLGASPIEAALATLASVGVCVGVLFIILTSEHAPLRGLGSIILIAWSFIVLALVGLNSALRGGLLTVPEALSSVGRLAAALLAGAALVPAITLPIAAHDKSDYDSAAAATSKYLGFIAKGVGIVVSGAASVYFGLSRGINPFVAALAGFVLESCFLWAYFMLIRAMKSRDAFDIWLWRAAVITFGLFLAIVSVETISTLSNIDVTIVEALGEIGATLYVSAVGLSLILTILAHVAASTIDMPMQPASTQTIEGNQPPTVVKPSPAPLSRRIAGGIRGARAGIGEIRAAWTDTQPQPAQLNRASRDLPAQADERASTSVNSTAKAGEEVPARPSKS